MDNVDRRLLGSQKPGAQVIDLHGWWQDRPLFVSGILLVGLAFAVTVAAAVIAPSAEALSSTLSTAGGATATVAVTLIAVTVALRGEDRRWAAREQAKFKTRALDEADQWAREVIAALQDIYEQKRRLKKVEFWLSFADEENKKERLHQQRSDIRGGLATARLSLDDQYEELERRAVARVGWLEEADEEEAAAELSAMLEQLQQWHQNFSWLEAFIEHEAVAPVKHLPTFRNHAENIRQRYAQSVPEQYTPARA